jgi:hypothetical protein
MLGIWTLPPDDADPWLWPWGYVLGDAMDAVADAWAAVAELERMLGG